MTGDNNEKLGAAAGEPDEINYTYCTEFVIEKKEKCPDPFILRAYLETIGDNVVVIDDEKMIRAHVHTNDPGNAIQKALEYGTLENDPRPKIENMRKLREEKTGEDYDNAKTLKQFGFVAIAEGDGIVKMFVDLGADEIVRGGQTKDPSAEDLLKAILATPAHTVFVLPDSKNLMTVAGQAAKMADKEVCVLQTENIPQGLSAMIAFDETLDLASNKNAMTEAFEKIHTGQIAFALDDSGTEGNSVKQGEIIAYEDGRPAFTANDIGNAVVELAARLIKEDTSRITLVQGADVTDEEAESVHQLLISRTGEKTDVILLDGGQPAYPYIIYAE